MRARSASYVEERRTSISTTSFHTQVVAHRLCLRTYRFYVQGARAPVRRVVDPDPSPIGVVPEPAEEGVVLQDVCEPVLWVVGVVPRVRAVVHVQEVPVGVPVEAHPRGPGEPVHGVVRVVGGGLASDHLDPVAHLVVAWTERLFL